MASSCILSYQKRKRGRRRTTKGRKNTRNYLEEKRRETKTVFMQDIQDTDQLNIRFCQIFTTQINSISENLHNVPHGRRWRRAIREGAAAVEERSAERKQQPREKQPEL
jgi:hypothetical protein